MITYLRKQIIHLRAVSSAQARLIRAHDEYDVAPTADVASRIAANLAYQAEHLDSSWLARVCTFLPTPEQLRETAMTWESVADGSVVTAAYPAQGGDVQ